MKSKKEQQKHSGKNAMNARGNNGSSSKNKRDSHERKEKHGGMHSTRIDLSEKTRQRVCQLLNQTLAETLDMYSQTKQAHWNVKGVHFYQLHQLFDEIAGDLIEYVDLFAERVTALAGTAMGTVRMSADASTIDEYPVELSEGMQHVEALAERLAQYGEGVRENIDVTDDLGDKVTTDIYTEVSREIDKWLWFLEAHLQGDTAQRELKGVLQTVSSR